MSATRIDSEQNRVISNSHDNLPLVIILTEGGRRASFLLLEDAVEVTYVIETTFVADVSHTISTVHQLSGSMS